MKTEKVMLNYLEIEDDVKMELNSKLPNSHFFVMNFDYLENDGFSKFKVNFETIDLSKEQKLKDFLTDNYYLISCDSLKDSKFFKKLSKNIVFQKKITRFHKFLKIQLFNNESNIFIYFQVYCNKDLLIDNIVFDIHYDSKNGLKCEELVIKKKGEPPCQ